MAKTDGDGVERRAVPRPRRLWEKVREKVRHLQARMDQEWERLRINRSLGRRVSRQVVSPDSRLILDRGEAVTPSAVAHARQSGALEVLLDAVDDGAEVDTSV
ncbi:MAG: hypothetical protein ACREOF_08780 [Gemmatimonadales bacterium]